MSDWNSDKYYNQEHYNSYHRYSLDSENPYPNNRRNSSGSNYSGSFERNQDYLGMNRPVLNSVISSSITQDGSSNSSSSRPIDIRHSKLTPTAAEFRPRNQIQPSTENSSVNGAIKKNLPHNRNKKHNSTYKNTQCNSNFIKKHHIAQDDVGGRNQAMVDIVKENNVPSNINREYHKSINKGYGSNQENYHTSKDYHKNSRVFHSSVNNGAAGYFKRNGGRNKHVKYNKRYESQYKDTNSYWNWRDPLREVSEIEKERKDKRKENIKDFKAASQRERLQQLLEHLQLECLVCYDRLCHTEPVWSCKQCYNILHLNCVKQWANTAKLESGWRCPACQNMYADVPNDYFCYCDKLINPNYEPGIVPHSCGETCGRKGRTCDHTCVILCHPGPCPDCAVSILKPCSCGSTKATVTCGADVPVTCQNMCKKTLNCGIHTCTAICHSNECKKCEKFVQQECYCGKLGRKVLCTEDIKGNSNFECGDICGKLLDCGNHKCELVCHSGSCPPCVTSVDAVTTCPCGQTKLTVIRKSCCDPIPACEKICNKTFTCGQPNELHHCLSKCHEGPCPQCPLTTTIKCRCGYMDKKIPCKEVSTKADDARCNKKCSKLRRCGKHKCNQLCCIEIDHVCPLPCNRMLSCGLHRCEDVCHTGRCSLCWRSSFQELYCECGSSVIFPPVPCGTKPPTCYEPCPRPRSCGHDVFHNCHAGSCPPCTVLSKRWCHGKHEQRNTILCYQDDFSCGLSCGKDMPCGQHKCIQTCHPGNCIIPCTQPCPKIRSNCEHPCSQPCHTGDCPDVSCKQIVRVTCQCGLRSSTRTCMDLTGEYQSIAMTQLASKIADIQKGQAVDITDIVGGSHRKCGTLKTLECTEECRVAERNRRLAIGLQIRNPDLSAKLTPKYSDFMRNWAKKDPRFCQHIHDKLTELVQRAKQSKQKSRSHSFETMNRDKRSFVHEYCQMFGCESEAYDAEPNRNVVATAYRDRSWLPSIGLLELLQRESGQRKVPGPVWENKNNALPKRELVPLRSATRLNYSSTPQPDYVDYFDDPPA